LALSPQVVTYYAFKPTLLLHPFNGLFYSLDLNEARDDGVWGCSGISWTVCKQSAPRFRQITTPTSHHSIFTGRMLFLTPDQQRQRTEANIAPLREGKMYPYLGYYLLRGMQLKLLISVAYRGKGNIINMSQSQLTKRKRKKL